MERLTQSGAICAILASGDAPKSIMVIPAGKFGSRDGRDPWVNDDPEAVLAATRELGMEVGLPIDYDHATDLAAPQGHPAPAAGWMTRFFTKAGEIWADVNWTEEGAKAVAGGLWRYFSPVFDYTKKGRHVTRIMRGALTNNPALYDTAIAAKSHQQAHEVTMNAEQFRTKMSELMGWNDAMLQAICAKEDGMKMEPGEFQAKMAAMFGLDKGASHEDICAAAEKHFKKAKAGSMGNGDMDEDKMAAKLIASGAVVAKGDYDGLLKDVNQLKTDQLTARAAAKAQKAIDDMKLRPAQLAWATAYCARDEKGFEEFVKEQLRVDLGASPIFKGTPPAPGTPEAGLSAEERAVCSAMNISAKKYAEQKGKPLNLETESHFTKATFNLGKE